MKYFKKTEHQDQIHGGMEHVPDTMFITPFIDDKIIRNYQAVIDENLLNKAIAKGDLQKANYLERAEFIINLAYLARCVLLGQKEAFYLFEDAIQLLATIEDNSVSIDLSNEKSSCSDKIEELINFTTCLDILLTTELLLHKNEGLTDQVKNSLMSEIFSIVSRPILYSKEAGNFNGTENTVSFPAQYLSVFAKTLSQIEHSQSKKYHLVEIKHLTQNFVQKWNDIEFISCLMKMFNEHSIKFDISSNKYILANEFFELEINEKIGNQDIIGIFSPNIRSKVIYKEGKWLIKAPNISGQCHLILIKSFSKKSNSLLDSKLSELKAAFNNDFSTSSFGMIHHNKWAFPLFANNSRCINIEIPPQELLLHFVDNDNRVVPTNFLVSEKDYIVEVRQLNSEEKLDFPLGIVNSNAFDSKKIDKYSHLVRFRNHGSYKFEVELANKKFPFDVFVFPDEDIAQDIQADCLTDNPSFPPEKGGSWNRTIDNALSLVGVHATVLHTGKVLYFSFDHRTVNNEENLKKYFNNPNLGSYQIWDPLTGKSEEVQQVGRNVFCAGHTQLPNGHILVAGGQDGAGAFDVTGEWDKGFAAGGLPFFWIPGLDTNNGSSKDIHTYDPINDKWTRWPDMEEHRYYPTCELTASGECIVVAGLSNLMRFIASGANWNQNDHVEKYNHNFLHRGAISRHKFRSADQYPIIKSLPGSNFIFVHIHNTTSIYNLSTQSFLEPQFTPPSPVGRWTYPMQTGHVLLPQIEGENPKIFICGGSQKTNFDYNTQSDGLAVKAGFIFEFNNANILDSGWKEVKGKPHVARLLNDTVLLPDGNVLIVNGISGGASSGHNKPAVFVCELFNPETEEFELMETPDINHPRGYHATAILLPDGRIAISGHTRTYNIPIYPDDTSIQIFNPPYLFKGERPSFTLDIKSAIHGQNIYINYNHEVPVAFIMLMKPCSITHTVDMGQRAVKVIPATDLNSNTLSFSIPMDKSLVTPGFYMIFLISEKGVPSIAEWIQIGEVSDNIDEDECNPSKAVPLNYGDLKSTNRTIINDGDIHINKIEDHANVRIMSKCGSVYIADKINQHCWVDIHAKKEVIIGHSIEQHCIVNINCNNNVIIGHNRDDGKIDQHCDVKICTNEGKVLITQKIEANSSAFIEAKTSDVGITIGQKIDGHSIVTLLAPNGDVEIGQKVGGDSSVTWGAKSFSCRDVEHGYIDEYN